MATAWAHILGDVQVEALDEVFITALRARLPQDQNRLLTATQMRYVVDQDRKGLFWIKDKWMSKAACTPDGEFRY